MLRPRLRFYFAFPCTRGFSFCDCSSTQHACGCQHHQQANATAAGKAKQPTLSEACQSHDGPCAICAFYASAQARPDLFELTYEERLVCVAPLLEVVYPHSTLLAAVARGPPTV